MLVILAAVACSDEPRDAVTPRAPPATSRAVNADAAPRDAAALDATADASTAPATLADALAALRARGFDDAADAIDRRARQRASKMKLAPAQALAAAHAVLAIGERPEMRALHAVMPRSLVELARAVAERGVTVEEADAIARYLVRVVDALAFERLGVFDENHSHVCGREWHEIDYSGEGMTWQGQRADWAPKGVLDFKRARHIHAYFTGAERLPHWKRVYRPRGRMADVAPP